jgi:hypothetical protein
VAERPGPPRSNLVQAERLDEVARLNELEVRDAVLEADIMKPLGDDDRSRQAARAESVLVTPGRLVDRNSTYPVDEARQTVGTLDWPASSDSRPLDVNGCFARSDVSADRQVVQASGDAGTGAARSQRARSLPARSDHVIDRCPQTAVRRGGRCRQSP